MIKFESKDKERRKSCEHDLVKRYRKWMTAHIGGDRDRGRSECVSDWCGASWDLDPARKLRLKEVAFLWKALGTETIAA